jgi:putative DNA primase/helicase
MREGQAVKNMRNPSSSNQHPADAQTIAKALGGRRVGSYWMAKCPCHSDRVPSLSITDAKGGKVLVHCHTGCDQMQVIAALHSLGLWEIEGRHKSRSPRKDRPRAAAEPDPDALKRTEVALAIWEAATPAGGTLVETYLASRGLHITPPSTLRFHGGLKHPSGGILPAMVALVTRGGTGSSIAIHRTFLARDGAGKAPVDPQRMMLGPCQGGAVRLGVAGDVVMVGEGIETCLAVMLATGNPAWAALSTSGLLTLDLPAEVRDVIVLADGDDAGETAARGAATRWKLEGRRVRIARPPKGVDFNDLLLGRRRPQLEGME